VILLLKGNIVALITPFDEVGNINYLKLSQLIAYQNFMGTDALVVLGSTGESTSLTDKEKEEIVRFVVKENASRLKIVVGVIESDTKKALEKSKVYEKLGADYLLVITPFYTKSNDNGIYEYFKLIASNINIPMLVYNVPSRTGVNISVDVLKKLKDIPNIIGIKEATTDVNHIIEVSLMCDHYFHLYGGNDELSYLFLSLNASGLINVVGNYNPELFEILLHTYEENPYLAYEYFKEIYPFLKSLCIEGNPIPIKELMNYLGYDVGKFRLPLSSMNINNKEKLLDIYKKTFILSNK
jgi:4-hydroxy-tetrahydrodipicolinate synthase